MCILLRSVCIVRVQSPDGSPYMWPRILKYCANSTEVAQVPVAILAQHEQQLLLHQQQLRAQEQQLASQGQQLHELQAQLAEVTAYLQGAQGDGTSSDSYSDEGNSRSETW